MHLAILLCTLAVSIPSILAHSINKSIPWRDVLMSAPAKGRYLYRTATAEPCMWIADTNWELFHRMNQSDVDEYLSDRASKGFTVMQAVLVSKLNATTIPDVYGNTVIANSDPFQINEGYFDNVDWIVRRAAEYGVLIAMVPIWGRYVNGGWYGGTIFYNESSMEYFGHYLGMRYPGIPMILGGDTDAFWTRNISTARAAWRNNTSLDPESLLGQIEDTRYLWAAMLRGLRTAENKTEVPALVTFQPTNPWITSAPAAYAHNYVNDTYGTLNMDGVQSGHQSPEPALDDGFTAMTSWDSTKNYLNIIEMRHKFAGPVVDVENHYEDAHDSFNTSRRVWNASDVRHGLYPAFFSGSCGFTYGNLAVQQVYLPLDQVARPDLYIEAQLGLEANSSWRIGIDRPGARQTGYVGRLFADLDKETFNTMTPDRSFIRSAPGPGQPDVLAFESDRYIAGLVTTSRYWVYSGHGDAFALDLESLAKYWKLSARTRVHGQWFDPRKGVIKHRLEFMLRGLETFTPPTSGGVDHDWILMVKTGT